MLKPCRREHKLNTLVSWNRPVLSLIHFGTVLSPWLSLSSALLGLLTKADQEDSDTWTVPQPYGSTQVQQVQPSLTLPSPGEGLQDSESTTIVFFFSLQYKYLGNYFQDCDIYVGEDNVDIFIEARNIKYRFM